MSVPRLAPLLPLLWACGPRDYVCDARVADDVNTVILLDVTAPDGTQAHVEFGEDGGLDRATPEATLQADVASTFALLGMPSLVDVGWQVVVDGVPRCSGSTSTRNLPSDLPEFTIETYDPARVSDMRYVLFATAGGVPGLVLVDRQGCVVWYRVPPDRTRQWVQPYWTDATALHNEFDSAHLEDIATIYRIAPDGTDLVALRTIEGHHTFTEFEPGVMAYLRRDRRTWFDPVMQIDQPVIGDAIVVQQPDGTERVLFSAWDWLEVRVTPEFYQPFWRDGRDWTHANAIHWNRETDTLLMSFSNLDTIVEIDRTTGVPVRWFGVDGEDPYGYGEGARRIRKPHDPRFTGPDTISVYITDDALGRSGVIEYRIDEANRVLEEVWSFGFETPEPSHRAFFLGQAWRQETATRRSSGRRRAGWSSRLPTARSSGTCDSHRARSSKKPIS